MGDFAALAWRDALCRVRAAAAAGHHSITPLLHSLQCRWPFRAFTAAAAVNVGAASVPRFCRASGLDGDAALATDHRISRRWRDLYLIGDEIDYDISDAWNGHGRIMQCDRGAPDCAARWHAYCGGTKTIVSVLEIRHATVRPLCDCTVSEAWCLHEQVESLWGTLQRSRGIQAW